MTDGPSVPNHPDGASPRDEIARLRSELARQRALADGAAGKGAQLERLQGAFLDNASHELRTPLTTILGLAELMEDEVTGPLTDDQRKFLGEIQGAATRLTSLVEDLLEMAQLQAGVLKLYRQECDLSRLLAEVVDEYRPLAEQQALSLAFEAPGEALLVCADARRVRKATSHLLHNAIKFTPAGGRVAVTVDRVPEGARVEVRDTGIGVDGPQLARMFDRFYQADFGNTRAHGGAGIGLSLAKGLIEAHGGRMHAQSAQGEGSRFGYTLPAREGC